MPGNRRAPGVRVLLVFCVYRFFLNETRNTFFLFSFLDEALFLRHCEVIMI